MSVIPRNRMNELEATEILGNFCISEWGKHLPFQIYLITDYWSCIVIYNTYVLSTFWSKFILEISFHILLVTSRPQNMLGSCTDPQIS